MLIRCFFTTFVIFKSTFPMDHYIVSARKYRPSTFDSVVGQKALTSTLRNAIASGRLAHSYLFCGSRGVGKTSCARIFAKTINCLNPTPNGEACNECDSCRAFNAGNSMNIIELDAASNNGVDSIRELVDQVQVPPSMGKYRVFIVDEVHMLSSAAFNAFLKTLEEPPSYVIFILATTEKHKIIPTILSRCQIYDFNRITVRDIIEHLAHVAQSEGFTAEPAALNVIARKADGAMRDALSIFDQVAASSRGNITYQSAIDNLNVLDHRYYDRLLDCFLGSKVLESWLVYKEIRDHGFDSHTLVTGLADYFRDLMVALDPSTICLLEADDEARAAMQTAASKCHPEFIYRAMNLCNEADLNYRTASNKQFLVELTLAKICQLSSPSPDEKRGGGEGQLQKIDTAATTRPAVAKESVQNVPAGSAQAPAQQAVQTQRATPAQEPATSHIVATAPPPPQYTPQVRPAGKPRVTLAGNTPRFSISGNNPTSSPAGQGSEATSQPAVKRDTPIDTERLHAAWKEFMKANPSRHILVNTMRASFPSLTQGTTYRMMVENEKQHQEMTEALPAILKYLRETLANDLLEIAIEINQGEASPHTWNERQVLAHMIENRPILKDFIDTFGLTL